MARRKHPGWFSLHRISSNRSARWRPVTGPPSRQRLRFEPLEERRLLALIVPNLSSLPGAPVTLHIDFDGTPAFLWDPTDDQWASGPAMGNNDPIPAFSIDGDVTCFSQDEIDGMIAIWQQVSEKFSPFNINVTTVAPPNYNDAVAVQLIVGGSNADWYVGSGGGVAQREGFTTAASNSGFVFTMETVNNLNGGGSTLNNQTRHFLAETVAHEAGHLFGLRHQSVLDAVGNVAIEYSPGDAITVPIMGDPGNNPGKRGIWALGPSSDTDLNGNPVFTGTQNDLNILTRPGNVIAYRPDDFGSFSGSGALNVNSQTGVVTGNGIIETNGDQDAFTFTAIGPVVGLTVRNAALGGMLAPTLELIPISGSAPSVILQTTNTSATITTNNATPGQGFVLRVSPQGNAYGSLGQYSISGSVGAIATLSAGVLHVGGYEADDDLKISYAPSTDNIIVQNDIFGGPAIQLFPRSQVSSIVVDLVGGQDKIDLRGPLSALSIPVTMNAGDGNDTLYLSGTSGDDVQSLIDATHGFNNATPFTFSSIENIIMSAFDGADVFNISALATNTSLRIEGGDQNDIINLAPNNPLAISAVNGPVTILGEGGSDTLNVGSGSLHAVSSLVTFHAGNGGNWLNLYDGANAFTVNYTISNTAATRNDTLFGGVNYTGVSQITLDATQSRNVITLNAGGGLVASIYGNGGDDDFVVGGGSIGPTISDLTAIGGEGTDRLVLDDHLSTHNTFPWFVYGETGDPETANKVFLALNEYSYDGFEGVEVLGGNGNNVFQIESASVPVVLRGGGGDDQFRFAQTGGVANNVTVDGQAGHDYLLVDDRNWSWPSFDATLAPSYLRRRVNLIFPENHDVNYSNVESIDFYGRLGTIATYVLGTSPDIPATHQTSLFLTDTLDDVYLFPRDSEGNLTINSNLGISGGAGTDSLVIEDSASPLPINYSFYNQFGPGTTNIGGLGAGTFGAGSDIEDITINAGSGDDTFDINTFQAGSALNINGSGGNDRVNFGASNLVAELTDIGPLHFDGQTGFDVLEVHNSAGPSVFSYSRNVGTLEISNATGANYSLTDQSVEGLLINGGMAADHFSVDGVEAGTTLTLFGGPGLDALTLGLPSNSLEAIQGRVAYHAQQQGGYMIVSDRNDTTPDTVHLAYIPDSQFESSSLGAHPGDNLFGPGGSLHFSNIVDFGLFPGISLDLGSAADTIYASPFASSRVTINGNHPTAAPGDKLNLALAQSENYVVTSNTGQFNLLHEFAGGAADGNGPIGTVVLDGSALYGTTYTGGDFNRGTVFRVNTDGTGFQLLHEFAGGIGNGAFPVAPLTLVGSTLYGTTSNGGFWDYGTVFRLNTDGSGFEVVHEFAPGATNGRQPWGPLTFDGSKLYGTTTNGGQFVGGIVFRLNTDGSGFEILHHFGGVPTDGRGPKGHLALDGATLYGTTELGGGFGTVYRVNTDGSEYQVLHQFAGGAADGSTPLGGVAVIGSTLFGTTSLGGDSTVGTIFRLNTDGSGYQLLHEFTGTADGSQPYGPLSAAGSTLYGTTVVGGITGNQGTVFRINADGSGYQILHSFSGGAANGANPQDAVYLAGQTLYGTTRQGGDFGLGAVFKLTLPGTGNVTSDNLATLDWTGIEQAISIDDVAPQVVALSYEESPQSTIRLELSEDVPQPLHPGYLDLFNETLFESFTATVSYDPGTDIALFTFPDLPGGRLPPGDYSAVILGSLSDLFGNPIGDETILTFSVAPPLVGDFDNDGIVGQSDHDVWKVNFGQMVVPFTSGDGNGDGIVDAADYVVWRDNLGAMAPAMGSGSRLVNRPPRLDGLNTDQSVTAADHVGTDSGSHNMLSADAVAAGTSDAPDSSLVVREPSGIINQGIQNDHFLVKYPWDGFTHRASFLPARRTSFGAPPGGEESRREDALVGFLASQYYAERLNSSEEVHAWRGDDVVQSSSDGRLAPIDEVFAFIGSAPTHARPALRNFNRQT